MPVIQSGTQIGLDGNRYPTGDPRLYIRPTRPTPTPTPMPTPAPPLSDEDPKALVRTVRVVERSVHHFSAMRHVAITQGLAQSWVVAVPAESVPVELRVMIVGSLGVKPDVAFVSLSVQKVASGAGDLESESDSLPVVSQVSAPQLVQDPEDDNVWCVGFTSHEGESPAVEPQQTKVALMEAGWYRSIIRVRWAS